MPVAGNGVHERSQHLGEPIVLDEVDVVDDDDDTPPRAAEGARQRACGLHRPAAGDPLQALAEPFVIDVCQCAPQRFEIHVATLQSPPHHRGVAMGVQCVRPVDEQSRLPGSGRRREHGQRPGFIHRGGETRQQSRPRDIPRDRRDGESPRRLRVLFI